MRSFALAFAVASSLPAQENTLPTYTYAIQSGDFKEGGLLLSGVHYRVPNTAWLCSITYRNEGLVARCSTPTLVGNTEIITRVSCANIDRDSETVNLSTLTPGVYASVFIECKKDIIDDGF